MTRFTGWPLRILILLVCAPLLSYLAGACNDASARKNPAYLHAVDVAKNSPVAQSLLGDSIQTTGRVKENGDEAGPKGHMEFNVDVAASRGKAELYIRATEEANVWRVDEVSLKQDGQTEWHQIPVPQ